MNEIKQKLTKLKKDKKVLLLLAAGVIGMVLICVSSVGGEAKKTDENYYSLCKTVQTDIENKLSSLLKNTRGVGKADVIIMLDSLEEYIYADDNLSDGEKSENEFVIIKNNGDETGLTKKLIMPVVRGVAISCEGGGSAQVKLEVTQMVAACLGIPTSRVYVCQMQSKK